MKGWLPLFGTKRIGKFSHCDFGSVWGGTCSSEMNTYIVLNVEKVRGFNKNLSLIAKGPSHISYLFNRVLQFGCRKLGRGDGRVWSSSLILCKRVYLMKTHWGTETNSNLSLLSVICCPLPLSSYLQFESINILSFNIYLLSLLWKPSMSSAPWMVEYMAVLMELNSPGGKAESNPIIITRSVYHEL